MWTITYTNPDGVVEPGPEYEKEATAQLAATWRGKKRNQTWVAVEVINVDRPAFNS